MASVGDLARVVVNYDASNQQFQHVFGFEAIDPGATLSNLSSAFQTAVVKNTSGGLLYGLTDNLGTSSLRVVDVKPGTAATIETSYAAVYGSDAGDDTLPYQCSFVISWKTGLAGRAYRGRTYVTGFGEDRQSLGVWDAQAISNMNALATQLLAVFGPSGTNPNWQFVVISEQLNNVPRAEPIGTPIVSANFRSAVRTQRRRAIGIGV